jgi:hypothetical protein
VFIAVMFCSTYCRERVSGWDLAEWSERRASSPKIASLNHSSGSELTLRSDLLLTAKGSSMQALIKFAYLLCYPGNTLCSQRLEPPGRVGTNPQNVIC